MLLSYLLFSLLCGSVYCRVRGGPIAQFHNSQPNFYNYPLTSEVHQPSRPNEGVPVRNLFYRNPSPVVAIQDPQVSDVPNWVSENNVRERVRHTPAYTVRDPVQPAPEYEVLPQVVSLEQSSPDQNQVQPLRYRQRERNFQAVPGSVSSPRAELVSNALVGSVLRNPPSGARLLRTVPPLPGLVDRLPDNSTLIRPNIVDTFTCEGKKYGYYADVDNECQIFHVCFPLQDIWPTVFKTATTYTFSFICPEHTIFSQDAMVCAWETEAIPCADAAALYTQNEKFFTKIRDEEGKVRWANLGDKLPLNVVTEEEEGTIVFP